MPVLERVRTQGPYELSSRRRRVCLADTCPTRDAATVTDCRDKTSRGRSPTRFGAAAGDTMAEGAWKAVEAKLMAYIMVPARQRR